MTSGDALRVELQTPSGSWVIVGYLVSVDNRTWFESDADYWRSAGRPVLGQKFEDNGPEWKPSATRAIPKWFSHLLPEGTMRRAISRAAGVSEHDEFRLLRTVGGSDLHGAVRTVPIKFMANEPRESFDIEQPDEEEGIDPAYSFSLDGLQPKFSLSSSHKGIAVPVKGAAGNLIVKLPDPRPGFENVPQAEFAAMSLAKEVGIPTPDISLMDVKSITGIEDFTRNINGLSFGVERYDRKKGGRVHSEELAQVMDISVGRHDARYDQANFELIAELVAEIASVGAVGDLIDRIVLNVLVGNGDAHLKNWSFIYPDGVNAVLSPVYDVVPTVLYIGNGNLGLNLDNSKRFEDVTAVSFQSIGMRTGFGPREAMIRAKMASERVMDSFSIMKSSLAESDYKFLEKRAYRLPLSKV